MKLILFILSILALTFILNGCQSPSSSGTDGKSGVQMYGTVDVGYGYTETKHERK